MSAQTPTRPVPGGPPRVAAAGLVALLVAVAGLAWAKWLPYGQKAGAIARERSWAGTSLLDAGAGDPALQRALEFTAAYAGSVWRALVVALVVSAAVDALVPRCWLLGLLGRRTALGGSLAGGLASVPSMMCTCCTAPLSATLGRSGAPLPAALAFWLGNPVLNPAVLVFLGLLAPWPWVAVRLGLGLVLVVGASAVLGRVLGRRRPGDPGALAAALDDAAGPEGARSWSELGRAWLRSLARLAVVVVPEYLAAVFVIGLVAHPLGRALGHGGAAAVLVAAVVGVVVVLPTGGEVPVLLALASAGASAPAVGALLIALPAVSLPSALLVGRALGWRVTAATGAATVVVALGGGAALAALG